MGSVESNWSEGKCCSLGNDLPLAASTLTEEESIEILESIPCGPLQDVTLSYGASVPPRATGEPSKGKRGMRVQLRGFRRAELTKLNGVEGVLLSYNADGTWNVRLDVNADGQQVECNNLKVGFLKFYNKFGVVPAAGPDILPPAAANLKFEEESFVGALELKGAALQKSLGPQSKRGKASQHQLDVLDRSDHAKACFETLAKNEEQFCDEWAVFYHSYSYSALIYEVQAALAAILFDFDSTSAPLPRIWKYEFDDVRNVMQLQGRFASGTYGEQRDHHPKYRQVAISAMCSLVSLGPESSTPVVFMSGYKHEDEYNWIQLLEDVLVGTTVGQRKRPSKAKIRFLMDGIIALCEKYRLDVRKFGGHSVEQDGHLLQIFIKRDDVDQVSYAAAPWGHTDETRDPISEWLAGDHNTSWGQARILAKPDIFCDEDRVKMFVASADQEFHANRPQFQEELVEMLSNWLGDDLTTAKSAVEEGPMPETTSIFSSASKISGMVRRSISSTRSVISRSRSRSPDAKLRPNPTSPGGPNPTSRTASNPSNASSKSP